ncbi:HipA domain-containing protein [Aquabacterium sp. A7-Y]|uniref:type II toxin-antitoxin system HipA family toxin n=1 Tax=Aquabacterium sp. A7-Y TaxID=1349605 RepID=UPI00223D0258|nr:HipA domain-containing protein [Aquabacterium sp. A7-Y]MCW7537935.1 HipA domain-containing protein [Aquabacterium sp. A7-Y]
MAKSERKAIEVHIDAHELSVRQQVGTLYRHDVRTDLAAPFEYDRSWLESRHAFLLDPRLELWPGEQHPAAPTPAFGIFMDSAPDRWGRVLMERREAAAAQREDRKMRRLQELDFLLGVHDLTRLGALRFRALPQGPFLDNSENAAPPVTHLKELAYISRRVEEPGAEQLPEYERWLAMLIAPGTSLGGARPKANFTDGNQRLWLAKFPAHDDRYDVGGWEFVVHRLAARAGIGVPDSRLERLTERYGTFCAARFDRVTDSRRMYASAMTLLERQDGESGAGYPDLAEFIADEGAQGHIDEDLAQLFRRAVFNVQVGNRDDHLRNHGFIREASGWRLSPAFDMNPNPFKSEHALTLDENSAAPSTKALLDTAELYRLDRATARTIVEEVSAVVDGWKDEAQRQGLSATEVRRMASVFLQA